MSKVAVVPGFAAKKVEDTKFKADLTLAHPRLASHGGRNTFVSSAMEDGGRIGAHGHVVMRMLAEHAAARGRLPPRTRSVAPPSPPGAVSMWVRR